ncbi:maleylpyruvate isomerase family mycothiol-dependent enzyme [Psychromicrobium xiongbiense]|uniref:maleylpyruvate isomerase family mycothiol-dependent enzyme n=1 Tax=Psychromicrobium xiongbiense TaxID=3051184 RepID=UPI0025532511|nr:maleylpyruvate isomerase family mycothiol-dependent enzyme [Psychromicrobium sp. YIM S02556]
MTVTDLPVVAESLASAHSILDWLAAAPEAAVREPSVLPGWTRAHVLAHLRGVSHAVASQLEYALRHEQVVMYDGGADGRNADISRIAALEQPALEAEVRQAFDRLNAAVSTLNEGDLALPTAFWNGPVSGVLGAMARELLLHHADLAIGYTSNDFSEAFSLTLIDFLEARVPEKTRLLIQPLGRQPLVLTNGNVSGKTIVITGMLTDIAAWLAGRQPVGQVSASAAADAVELPVLKPWPAPPAPVPASDPERSTSTDPQISIEAAR